MNDRETAALRRKYAATQEPAKRNELGNLLRDAGVDPDAVEKDSAAPKGRTAPVRQTTEQSRPVAKAAVRPAAPKAKEISKDSADKPVVAARRPGRPAKTETPK